MNPKTSFKLGPVVHTVFRRLSLRSIWAIA